MLPLFFAIRSFINNCDFFKFKVYPFCFSRKHCMSPTRRQPQKIRILCFFSCLTLQFFDKCKWRQFGNFFLPQKWLSHNFDKATTKRKWETEKIKGNQKLWNIFLLSNLLQTCDPLKCGRLKLRNVFFEAVLWATFPSWQELFF